MIDPNVLDATHGIGSLQANVSSMLHQMRERILREAYTEATAEVTSSINIHIEEVDGMLWPFIGGDLPINDAP